MIPGAKVKDPKTYFDTDDAQRAIGLHLKHTDLLSKLGATDPARRILDDDHVWDEIKSGLQMFDFWTLFKKSHTMPSKYVAQVEASYEYGERFHYIHILFGDETWLLNREVASSMAAAFSERLWCEYKNYFDAHWTDVLGSTSDVFHNNCEINKRHMLRCLKKKHPNHDDFEAFSFQPVNIQHMVDYFFSRKKPWGALHPSSPLKREEWFFVTDSNMTKYADDISLLWTKYNHFTTAYGFDAHFYGCVGSLCEACGATNLNVAPKPDYYDLFCSEDDLLSSEDDDLISISGSEEENLLSDDSGVDILL